MVLTSICIVPGKLNVGIYAAIVPPSLYPAGLIPPVLRPALRIIMKYSPRVFYLAQKQLRDSINKIPKKNKQKFAVDLIKLIEYAQKDNYDNFDF